MGDRRGVKLVRRLPEGPISRFSNFLSCHIDAAAGSLAVVRWTLVIKIVWDADRI